MKIDLGYKERITMYRILIVDDMLVNRKLMKKSAEG